jgi:hypothetical protein
MVVKLLEIVDSELDLQSCSDDDLTEVILDCPCIEVKYDNNSKVTELSSFDIKTIKKLLKTYVKLLTVSVIFIHLEVTLSYLIILIVIYDSLLSRF